MPRPRPAPSAMIDAAILSIFGGLALFGAYMTDLEYVAGYVAPPSFLVERTWSRWPVWLQRLSGSSGRAWGDAVAMLAVFGTGLAITSYRPRSGRAGGRSRPGDVASAITATVAVSWAAAVALDRWVTPLIPLPPGSSRSFGSLLTSYCWTMSRRVAWALLAAWLVMKLNGGWRPPRDRVDLLGRWIGWAWLAVHVWDSLRLTIMIG